MAEDFLSLHAQLADRARRRHSAIDVEKIVVAAVGVELGGEMPRSWPPPPGG
jgi:hypothetical protein